MKSNRMILETDAREILKTCNIGTLSLITPEGLPYGIPINYHYNEDKNLIYMHCALKGIKLDCISAHPEVSFSVYKNPVIIEERFTTHYESAIVTGHAEIIADPIEKRTALIEFSSAICPDGAYRLEEVVDKYWHAVTMLKIVITRIEGKRNRDA